MSSSRGPSDPPARMWRRAAQRTKATVFVTTDRLDVFRAGRLIRPRVRRRAHRTTAIRFRGVVDHPIADRAHEPAPDPVEATGADDNQIRAEFLRLSADRIRGMAEARPPSGSVRRELLSDLFKHPLGGLDVLVVGPAHLDERVEGPMGMIRGGSSTNSKAMRAEV